MSTDPVDTPPLITEWAILSEQTADSLPDLEECDDQYEAYRILRQHYQGVPARVVYRTISPWMDDK